MKPEKRYDSVKSLKLCFNCFDNGHMWPKCESSNKCLQKDCEKGHHSSLHKYFADKETKPAAKDGDEKEDPKEDDAEKAKDQHIGMLRPLPKRSFFKLSRSVCLLKTEVTLTHMLFWTPAVIVR